MHQTARTSRHAFLLVAADGSYDRRQIMAAAWRELRRPNLAYPDMARPTFSQALRWTWAAARQQRETTLHRIEIGMQEAA